MVVCETERLILREFEDADAASLFELNRDPRILNFIPGAPSNSLQDAKRVLRDVIYEDYRQFGFGRWAVELKTNGQVIGFCGPKYLASFNKVELGYRYFPEYWQRGFGYEAANATLEHLLKKGEIKDVIALIMPGNIGSERLAHKLQMKLMGMGELMGQSMHIFHKWL
ncbi:GCN5 family acetyltransferase [Shewanella mangrovi]|uniref:GCN5 family acetyltransferase n=1 Tax=Shewanella mangrovi TaxID=1515746 RepID=A0A094LRY9_9GAMM|nr:GNAT family N-acetyltransferase [Shewanella mangrovi]KFZ37953.1 GCN5 family acetyltransferase [Shewanella mangrovi]